MCGIKNLTDSRGSIPPNPSRQPRPLCRRMGNPANSLNSRANFLAHYLQALGVGKEVLVGICMERSLEMVVGLLGILKAGGAYVPLDPAYPTERLAFMLEDTQSDVPRNPDYVRRNTSPADNEPRARTFARLIESSYLYSKCFAVEAWDCATRYST